MIDLRMGPWTDALADVVAVDVLLTDPPFSERTHRGFKSGSDGSLAYQCITEADAGKLAAWAREHVRWWAVIMTDHVAWQWLEAAFSVQQWMTFAPVVVVWRDPVPRLQGDGPCSAATHVLVARPRQKLPRERTGSRPGWYESLVYREGLAGFVGQKPPALMSALVRDYTIPGDLVCDPYAGSGTTAIACCRHGRRFVGAEVDPRTNHYAVSRLEEHERQTALDLG